jgi:hypothetical protein
MRKQCVNCRFFFPLLHEDVQEGDVLRAGLCRRRAPAPNGFPFVLPMDWCGEHEIDVNKLEPVVPRQQPLE